MTTTETLILCTELKNKHSELNTWKISFNKRKSSFGLCNYTDKEIQLSSVLIPTMTDKAIFETIVHELAHALTKGHGHDSIWRRKCIELGGDGQRVGGSEKIVGGEDGKIIFMKSNYKYTLTCPVCDTKSYVNRLPKRACSCSKHGRYYDSKYKLTVTQNY